MTASSSDSANVGGFRYWEEAWNTVQGVQGFSPVTTAVERAKWNHLLRDLEGRTSGRALEVGCGSGHFGALLARTGFDVALLDYSPAGIACAVRSFLAYGGRDRKRYLLGDALTLPIRDNSIDLVVSCGVLEHFERPLDAVREMARVLKPGGLFYADICPARFSLLRMVEFLMPQKPGWFEIRMSRPEVKRLVEGAGLNVRRLFAAGVFPPRSVPGTGRILPLRLLQQFLITTCAPFWTSLDGTPIADALGFYYYVTAVKPNDPTRMGKGS